MGAERYPILWLVFCERKVGKRKLNYGYSELFLSSPSTCHPERSAAKSNTECDAKHRDLLWDFRVLVLFLMLLR